MRWQNFTRGDTVPFTDGDLGWLGIDSTHDRDKIIRGMLYEGRNTRLRTGSVKQRGGTQIPQDFNPTGGFENSLVGAGLFKDPLGRELLLVAPASVDYTVALAFSRDPVQIDYATSPAPTGDNGSGIVEFVQTFDKVHLLRIPNQGSPGENLVWNGGTTATDADRWNVTTLSTNGFTLVPAKWHGEPWGDRCIFYTALWPGAPERDTWIVTDLYDYSSYDPVYQTIRTNAAQSDTITRIKAYMKGSAIIYKNKTVHLAQDLGTYPFSVGQRKLADIGSIGINMPLDIGGDQIFLSQPNGFYRLSEIIQDQIVALPVPISEGIQRVIDQINWPYTTIWGCSAALGNYAFFGVCLGPTAQRLNTVLVYDTQRRQWESAGDTWRDPSFAFNKLISLDFGGTQRLCAVDYNSGTIYLLYEGVRDELRTGSFSVPFRMVSRGYVGSEGMAIKKFGRLRVSIASWDPKVNITAKMDGVNEEFLLTEDPITKSNANYYSLGKDPFNPLTDDPRAPYREDYSTSDFDNFVAEDFESLPEGEISMIPGTLFEAVTDMQESVEPLMVRQMGRHCSIIVENDEGQVEVQAIELEGQQSINTIRTAA